MYQVITLYGDFEPWWFLEDWRQDIIREEQFASYPEALRVFEQRWQELRCSYPYYHSRRDLLAAFWDDKSRRWCEDCCEPVQQYKSLLLLKDDAVLSLDKYMDYYEQANASTQELSTCLVFTTPKKD